MSPSTLLTFAAALGMAAAPVRAQPATASIHGQVTDPSGRGIPNADVAMTSRQDASRTAKSDFEGRYQLRNVSPGVYSVRVEAKGFAPAERAAYAVTGGASQVLDLRLTLAPKAERVDVQDAVQVELDPSSNASALIIRGKELDALSDDRDDLAVDLAALAGPAAGPNGGQVYLDGFTGG